MGNKLAFIVCSESQWPEGYKGKEGISPIIYTLRLPGETDGLSGTLTKKLEEAAKNLPFKILFRYVTFHSTTDIQQLFDEMEISEIIDSPGAPSVSFDIRFSCERLFYLPRDPVTGDFIDLEKQVQCLSVLRHPADRKK